MRRRCSAGKPLFSASVALTAATYEAGSYTTCADSHTDPVNDTEAAAVKAMTYGQEQTGAWALA